MKAFIVLALVAAATAAPEPPTAYGYPSGGGGGSNFGGYSGGNGGSSSGGYPGGSSSAGYPGGSNVGNLQTSGGQVHRHVYVHVAPDDPEDQQARVVRIPGKNDKHVNIIFVKTPSASSSAQTEVILPEQDEQKNIVYVLVRKFDPTTDLKIRAPRPTSPSKPEVYFIRYKNQQGGEQQGGHGGQQGGHGGQQGGHQGGGQLAPPASNPRPEYGAPF